jgi:hypothetical protein
MIKHNYINKYTLIKSQNQPSDITYKLGINNNLRALHDDMSLHI